MSTTYEINLEWTKKPELEYKYEVFNRDHKIALGGNQTITNSSAPEFFGNKEASNPEELLAAALASCHMLTFLVITAKSGYVVEKYDTKAVSVLDKNEEGKMAVVEIQLFPKIVFSGEKIPSADQLKVLHDKSHHNCFIAQSIKTKVTIF